MIVFEDVWKIPKTITYHLACLATLLWLLFFNEKLGEKEIRWAGIACIRLKWDCHGAYNTFKGLCNTLNRETYNLLSHIIHVYARRYAFTNSYYKQRIVEFFICMLLYKVRAHVCGVHPHVPIAPPCFPSAFSIFSREFSILSLLDLCVGRLFAYMDCSGWKKIIIPRLATIRPVLFVCRFLQCHNTKFKIYAQ